MYKYKDGEKALLVPCHNGFTLIIPTRVYGDNTAAFFTCPKCGKLYKLTRKSAEDEWTID